MLRERAGRSVLVLRRAWWVIIGGMSAYMLAVIWLFPVLLPGWLRLVANVLHAGLPRWFADGTAQPGVLVDQQVEAVGIAVLVAAPFAIAGYAGWHRDSLAAGYAAADRRLADWYLDRPGGACSAAALLLAGFLFEQPIFYWLAGVTASQAVSELLTRLVVARGNRLRTAGGLLGRCLRTRSFPGAMAVAGLLFAQTLWFPRDNAVPPTADQMKQVRADPQVAAADAQAEQAYQAAVRGSAAASDLVRLHRLWQTGHLFETSVATALDSDDAFRKRMESIAAFWQQVQARQLSAEDIRDGCDEVGQATTCRTTRTGQVDGSDGRLAFRLTAPDYTALLGPASSGMSQVTVRDDAADVFQRDGDSWRLVVHAAIDGAELQEPRQVASAAGPLLVIPAEASGPSDATALYVAGENGWQWLDTGAWIKQAADVLPDHACLLHTLYANPSEPMFTSLQPDYRSLTMSALYGADPAGAEATATGRIDLRLGIVGHALVVVQSTIVPFPRRHGWFGGLFAAGPQC